MGNRERTGTLGLTANPQPAGGEEEEEQARVLCFLHYQYYLPVSSTETQKIIRSLERSITVCDTVEIIKADEEDLTMMSMQRLFLPIIQLLLLTAKCLSDSK